MKFGCDGVRLAGAVPESIRGPDPDGPSGIDSVGDHGVRSELPGAGPKTQPLRSRYRDKVSGVTARSIPDMAGMEEAFARALEERGYEARGPQRSWKPPD